MVSEIDIYIARKKIRLKNSNYCSSFISTLWKGEVVMCTFDNLQSKISSLFCISTLDEESFSCLESVIREFINELSSDLVKKVSSNT